MDKIKNYFQDIYQSFSLGKLILGILVLEVLSFTAFSFPELNPVFFVILIGLTLILAIKNLFWGILILLGDLIINSKGYLFAWSFGNFSVSIRLGLFVAVFIAFFIWIIRDKKIRVLEWSLWKPYFFLIIVIFWGVLLGLLHGNSLANIFFDANGYLYLGLIAPLVQAVRSRKHVLQLFAVFLGAGFFVMLKTLLLLFIFSHLVANSDTFMAIYRWLRDTGVGEVTNMKFGFYRIFFQSHIYTVFIFFFVGTQLALSSWSWRMLKTKTFIFTYILFVWIFIKEQKSGKRIFGLLAILGVTFAIDIVFALGLVNFPTPGASSLSATSLLSERTKNITTENASLSRLSLLRPLTQASLNHPIFGSGLGSVLTYKSSDPRILETNPEGWYTTYAFEWGYLDLWFKFGFLGLLAYGYLLFSIFKYGLRRMKEKAFHLETLALLFSLLALIATHCFTPYLNHPLGIGWLIFVFVIITLNAKYDKEQTVVQQFLVTEPTSI